MRSKSAFWKGYKAGKRAAYRKKKSYYRKKRWY